MAKTDKEQNGGMGNGKRAALIVLVVILIAALLGGGIYAAWRFTDGFKTFPWQTQQPEEDAGNNSGTNPGVITGNYYVESDGMKYGDGGVMRLASGSAFAVGAGFGGGYSVKFTARKIASDFSFTLGAEPYQWNNVAGDDFTEGFTITKTGTGFTVEFGTEGECGHDPRWAKCFRAGQIHHGGHRRKRARDLAQLHVGGTWRRAGSGRNYLRQ